MPRGDGTGPSGQGPMTGRGAGWCSGSDAPGYASAPADQGQGRGGGGRGRGQGRGRGPGRWWGQAGGTQGGPVGPVEPTQLPAIDEREALQRQQQALRTQMARIEQKLDALSTTPDQD